MLFYNSRSESRSSTREMTEHSAAVSVLAVLAPTVYHPTYIISCPWCSANFALTANSPKTHKRLCPCAQAALDRTLCCKINAVFLLFTSRSSWPKTQQVWLEQLSHSMYSLTQSVYRIQMTGVQGIMGYRGPNHPAESQFNCWPAGQMNDGNPRGRHALHIFASDVYFITDFMIWALAVQGLRVDGGAWRHPHLSNPWLKWLILWSHKVDQVYHMLWFIVSAFWQED